MPLTVPCIRDQRSTQPPRYVSRPPFPRAMVSLIPIPIHRTLTEKQARSEPALDPSLSARSPTLTATPCPDEKRSPQADPPVSEKNESVEVGKGGGAWKTTSVDPYDLCSRTPARFVAWRAM